MTEYEAVQKILDRYGITDIDDLEYGKDPFNELIDYYADEMPYGVLKAREGTPDEWIYDKLCELGFDKPDPAVNHEKHQGREDIHDHYERHLKWKDMI